MTEKANFAGLSQAGAPVITRRSTTSPKAQHQVGSHDEPQHGKRGRYSKAQGKRLRQDVSIRKR